MSAATHIRSDAERYIETLTGRADTPVTFQTFDEGSSNGTLPQVLHGSLADHWERLVSLNNRGSGIFMMVNEGDLCGRRKENVRALRSLFTDDDGKGTSASSLDSAGQCPVLGPRPSMTVRSRAGLHMYFVLEPGEPLDEFVAAQKALAAYFETDPAVHDLPRVMRVPGFFHLKDPNAPYLVRLVWTNPLRHRIKEVVNACQPAPARARAAGLEERLIQARAWVASVPPAVTGDHGDNATYSLCCGLVRGFELSDEQALGVLRSWNDRCTPPWPVGQLEGKLAHARRYATERLGGRTRNTRPSTSHSGPVDASPAASLAFLVPLEQFAYTRDDGSWDLGALVGEAGAKAHLISKGCVPKKAAEIVALKTCVLAHGIGCRPDEGPLFREGERTYLNSYVSSRITPHPRPWPTIERVLNTVTGGDRSGRDWIINWMAAKVQNPGMRSMTALVLQGLHGTGKSLLGTILSLIIGAENCAAIGQRDLENSFNEPYVDKLLVLADEVVNRDNLAETSSKLKQMITDPKILMNGKHKAQRPIENRMTWFFTSNSATPVKVEGTSDRRFTVFSSQIPPDADYSRQLGALFDAAGEPTAEFVHELQGFSHALREHRVDSLMAKRPYANAARAELAAASMSSPEVFFEEVLERGIVALINDHVPSSVAWDFEERGVKAAVVYQAYRGFCSQGGFAAMNASNFGKELHQRHPEWRRGRLPADTRPWVYVGMPRQGRNTASVAA